ncbi:MAG: Flagellar biosynthesis protein FlhA [Syntrophus sp. PtaU1.Bin005]|jgi:flagellar biosynthesis protein FlhA|uniref:flagellar biosynthesis protein FlhA n=1 Tax=Syntrophus TaxID=43773 RepID=UPI0009CE977B|nr:MAG: Flagellar biosynthesis protein FlhA [Syntrophus sp. PtaB.Bin138]OPY83202.1 MAG: Flagellar biosynthesis protein FlhA [Syntrophus sp. PtaU1.Bin005]
MTLSGGKGILSEMAGSSSAMMALGVIGILMVMMIPLPTFLLDILLSLSITISIIILLMAMYVLKPLDFSIFPSVLLIVTLLRLSLNVASTRMILLHGNEGTTAAGQVIHAFGTFVVGGNYVVGFIVFAVLVLINFIVITKGSTRIAEVAARFTLDAMPGKQMSIDADLNAGLISDAEARSRRSDLEKETNFYGAMDGASKFVRGDAVAGIVITLINVIGGLIVGVMQKGMPAMDAARNYTLLTVGDGLVTQIPALIVSTAAGMLVTRSAASSDLGEELRHQLKVQPKAIATAASIILVFALIPGMPKISFLLVSALIGYLAYTFYRSAETSQESDDDLLPAVPAEEEPEDLLTPLDLLALEVGYGLIPLVDTNQGGELLGRIKTMRKQLALELGFIVPSIHIRDNLQLNANHYSFILKGVEIARGELMLGHFMAIKTDDQNVKIKGIETKEPAFGLPAVWISDREKESVTSRGYVVVDSPTVITTHLMEIIKTHADELMGRKEVQALVENLSKSYPKVIDDLVPKTVPYGILQKVIQRLLKERVSIRDLYTIVETLADYVPMTKNVDLLTGYVRQALARTITRQYLDQNGGLTVLMLSPDIEDTISQAVQHTEHESYINPDPVMIRKLVNNVQKLISPFTTKGLQPIILCSPSIRIHLRNIMDKFFPNIVVIAHNEVMRETSIKSLGMVEL